MVNVYITSAASSSSLYCPLCCTYSTWPHSPLNSFKSKRGLEWQGKKRKRVEGRAICVWPNCRHTCADLKVASVSVCCCGEEERAALSGLCLELRPCLVLYILTFGDTSWLTYSPEQTRTNRPGPFGSLLVVSKGLERRKPPWLDDLQQHCDFAVFLISLHFWFFFALCLSSICKSQRSYPVWSRPSGVLTVSPAGKEGNTYTESLEKSQIRQDFFLLFRDDTKWQMWFFFYLKKMSLWHTRIGFFMGSQSNDTLAPLEVAATLQSK